MSRRALRGAVLPMLLLAAWEGASRTGLADPRLLPSPEAVAAAAWHGATGGGLPGHLAISICRDLAGFALGAAAGLPFGFLLGLSRVARTLLGPGFDAVRQIAVFAWIPLIAMWFGIGETAKIVFIAIAAFAPVALNTAEGVRSASRDLLEVGAVFRFTRAQRIRRIFLPGALPSILTGVHLGLINAWLATIGAEYFMTAGSGIGGLVIEGRDRFDMAQVMLGVLLLATTGFAFNAIAAAGEKRLLRWRRV
ncbi:MAG: ABC transporter permease [Acetobacteraceae bacterium]|nr:ABC transporter permease [Acetobacteraceae bacterium]